MRADDLVVLTLDLTVPDAGDDVDVQVQGLAATSRIVPTLSFVRDALPEEARHLDEVLARARALDEAVAAQRGAAYAGDEDPYKKPREIQDEDADDGDLDDDADGAGDQRAPGDA